jgi:RNA polymerase sigma-70 factor, ECF subfamily
VNLWGWPDAIGYEHDQSGRATTEATVDQLGLVERARKGDHDAFAALVDANLARLDTVARLVLRDRELASDAVQETLIRAWRHLPGLRDPDRFDAWLRRLTMNACMDLARHRRRRPIEVELTELALSGSSDASPDVGDRELLDDALARLDAEHRAVVVLHYYLGLQLPEVAAALGIPTGTAKSRLHYALAAMRAVVLRDEPTPVTATFPGGQTA